MDALLNFGTWFFNHIYMISMIAFILWKGKVAWNIFVIQPLQGEDGITSNIELARYTLIILLVYMVYKEGEGATYPVEVFYALVVGVILVGGFEKFATSLIKNKK